MVEFELPEDFPEDFMALVPEQRMIVDELIEEGVIRSYSLSMDRTVLWVVLEAESEFEVLEVIARMPLSDFMHPYVSELMFHNGATALMHEFSLN